MNELYSSYSEKSNLPTIVKLKTVEKEINFLLAVYKSAHKDYIKNLRQGETDDAKDDLDKMNEINKKLTTLFGSLQTITSKVYPKGIKNQEMVTAGSVDLSQIDSQLGDYYTKIAKVQSELKDIEGKHSSTSKETSSARLQYYIFTIIAIWWFMAFVLLYYFRNSTLSGPIETCILAVAVLAIGYYVYTKFIKS